MVFMYVFFLMMESFLNMCIYLLDVVNVIFLKVLYEFRGFVCFILDEEIIILFFKISCIMLDKSEEIILLLFD